MTLALRHAPRKLWLFRSSSYFLLLGWEKDPLVSFHILDERQPLLGWAVLTWILRSSRSQASSGLQSSWGLTLDKVQSGAHTGRSAAAGCWLWAWLGQWLEFRHLAAWCLSSKMELLKSKHPEGARWKLLGSFNPPLTSCGITDATFIAGPAPIHQVRGATQGHKYYGSLGHHFGDRLPQLLMTHIFPMPVPFSALLQWLSSAGYHGIVSYFIFLSLRFHHL